MYGFGRRHLRSLEKLAASRLVSTSVETNPSGNSGFFSGGNSFPLPPLTVLLPGVKIPPPLPDDVSLGTTEITTLHNGVRIASEFYPSPFASVGLYVSCGSIYETPISYGATHLLEKMAFKTTTNRSNLRIIREAESIGGSMYPSASREQMGYTYDALKTHLTEMVELLIDCVRNPAFHEWEVTEQLRRLNAEVEAASKSPVDLIMEALHSVGYAGALSNSLIASESAFMRLGATILENFVEDNYTAPRMVLAASGVHHEEITEIAKPLLEDLPAVKAPKEPKSYYVGGEYRKQAASKNTHVALAFGVPGGWHREREAVTVTVLQMLMGGGYSFSAGGPGKGMHSRLYLRVLNEFRPMESCSAFSNIYNHTGLFGVHASFEPGFASKAVDLVARELIALASPGEVDQTQLNRAKEATKSAVLMNLESRRVASEDIGRQILTYGERKPIKQFLDLLEGITEEDIASVTERIISSPLTMASWGEVGNVPSYDYVRRKFRS